MGDIAVDYCVEGAGYLKTNRRDSCDYSWTADVFLSREFSECYEKILCEGGILNEKTVKVLENI